MDNVETGDEDARKNLGAIPSAKAVNPHHQQQRNMMMESPRKGVTFRRSTPRKGARGARSKAGTMIRLPSHETIALQTPKHPVLPKIGLPVDFSYLEKIPRRHADLRVQDILLNSILLNAILLNFVDILLNNF